MKTIKYLFAITILFTSFVSCSSDDSDDLKEENPVEGLNLVETIETDHHDIELYSANKSFMIGYNDISIRIKDQATNTYISNAEISWTPVMHMTSMMHSCPTSEVSLTENTTVSNGFIVFQMPGNDTEYWNLKLNYSIDDESFEASKNIEVIADEDDMRSVSSFMGSDNSRYVLAMVTPVNPEVKVNDFTAVLYKMEDMMTFSVVEDFTVTVDPRMPGMGNHSSPNNEDLTYNAASNMYDGKLSLTMTGYWKMNLKLLNEDGDVLKGEDVTEENIESSLYFDFEF
ncbi:hypothetical protein [Tamlana sp. I1]|uniref:hypothetical protein n=1 Tax=Tamlana sp. I1 TaxID=2762061 RepID=UPI00188FBB43|nr:hypothetical protein [Tamlana sp. I1]